MKAKIEDVVNLLQKYVKDNFKEELSVIYIEGGSFKNYQNAIKAIEKQPKEQQRRIVVWICMPEVELLRFPYENVEFNLKKGKNNIGMTGNYKFLKELSAV